MHLHELKKKEVYEVKARGKSLTVFLQSIFYEIEGTWHWDLATDEIFCSDVILSRPQGFTGTTAIFHPDDIPFLKEQLSAHGAISFVQFRIITTYGEVRTLTGENIRADVVEDKLENWKQAYEKTALNELAMSAELRQLQFIKDIQNKSHSLFNEGFWYHNTATSQTWYSGFIFRIHGVPPQSLNAHLHTFHSFIHPEDLDFFISFTDKAYKNKAPFYFEYRITAGDKEKFIAYKSHWVFSDKGEDIWCGTMQDITEQKMADAELQNYRSLVQFQKQQLAFDEQQANIGHWQIDLLTRKIVYSDNYFRIFGLKPGSVASNVNTFLNFIHSDDQDEVASAYRKLIYEHAVPDVEYRITRADGRIRYISQKGKLVMNDQSMVVTGIIVDITVQRQLEKKVSILNKNSTQKALEQEQAHEMAGMGSWIMDIESGAITWSENFSKLLGYKSSAFEMSQKSLFSFIHSHDLKKFKDHWNIVVKQKQEAIFQFRFLVRGSERYMKAVFRIHKSGEREVFIGTVQDITLENVLQQHLSNRVQLAESLTENIPDRVMITDVHHTIVLWNRSCEMMYGKKKADALGQNFFDVFPQLKTEAEMQMFHRALRGEKVVKEGMLSLHSNGHYNLYLMPLWKDDEVTGILHIVHDVTKEQELRNNLESRLSFIESLLQSSVDRIIALDKNLNYLYWNREAEKYYGIKKENVVGKNVLELFPQIRNDPSFAQFRTALAGEAVHIPANLELNKNFETYIIPIKQAKGEVSSLLWIAHDLSRELHLIQQQQEVQQQLSEEHLRLKEALAALELQNRIYEHAEEIANMGTWNWNPDTNEAHYSDKLFHLFGMKAQEVKQGFTTITPFIHPDDRERMLSLATNLKNGADAIGIEYRIIRKDGEERIFYNQVKLVRGEQGERIYVGTTTDITERKKGEQRLVQLKEELAQKATGRYLHLFNSIDEGFYLAEVIFNEAGQPVDIFYHEENPSAVRILGINAKGKKLSEVNPGYEQYWFDVYVQVALTGKSQRLEHYAKNFNKWFNFYVTKMGDESGSQIAIVFHDITDLKTARRELEQNRNLLQSVFDVTYNGLSVLKSVRNKKGEIIDMEYLFANEATKQVNKRYDLEGKLYSEVHAGFKGTDYFNVVKNVVETGESHQYQLYYHFEHLDHWFNVTTVKLNDGVVISFEDISEIKKAEKAVRESEERKAFLLQFSDALRPLSDPYKIQEAATMATMNFFGADRCYYCEIENNTAIIRCDAAKEGLPSVAASYPLSTMPIFKAVLDAGEPFLVQDSNITDLVDEEVRRLCIQMQILTYVAVPIIKHGSPEGILCITQSTPRAWTAIEVELVEEIAERIWAAVERAKAEVQLKDLTSSLEQQVAEQTMDLRESKEFVEEIMQTTPDLVTIYNAVTNEMIYTNHRSLWEGHFKVNAERAFKMKDEDRADAIVHPDDVKKAKTYLQARRLLKDGEMKEVDLKMNGDKFIRIRSRVFKRNEAGDAEEIISFTSDITAYKNAELEVEKQVTILKQAEDIAAIGSWEYQIPSGRFSWSDGMYQLFNYPKGAPVQPEIYLSSATEEDRSVAKRIIKNIKKLHRPFEELVHIKREDGVRLLKVKASVVKDEQGTLQKVIGVDLDITDINEAEEKVRESQRWLEQTAKASPDSITVYDLQKKQPIYLNNCLAEWTGYTLEELVAMGIEGRLQLIHPDDRLRLLHFNEKIASAKDGEVLTTEYRLRGQKEDRIIWLRNRSKIFQRNAEGKATHLLSILQDVTEAKDAEEILNELNESLAKKNKDLESKNEEITSFAFVASHDLKEPIRKLHTFTDLLITKETGISEHGKDKPEKNARLHKTT